MPINFAPEKAKEKIINIDGEAVQPEFAEIFPEAKINDIDYKKPKEEKSVLEHKNSKTKEEDFIYSSILDEKLSSYALSVLYDDYFKLRQKYLATLN